MVIIFSGGLDSTVLVYFLRELHKPQSIHLLTVNYGQRHGREILAASSIVQHLRSEGADVTHRVAFIPRIAEFLRSSQTTGSILVPHGHYTDESMKATVVPNRNMIMLSLAVGWAESLDDRFVYYGAHSGDHPIYADCRADFVIHLNQAVRCATEDRVSLMTPFQTMGKSDIVGLGDRLKVPFQMTYSCYEGGTFHCGKCGTCVERKEAFELAGVKDPTLYNES